MSEEKFSWVAIYKEIVEKIKDKRTEDLKKLLSSCEDCQTDYLKKDKDDFINLDLFTFFGSFNRDVKFENRMKVLRHLKIKLDLSANLPTDFNGIPTMENRNSFFYWADNLEKADDLDKLNDLFQQATSDNEEDLENKFNECLEIDGVGISKLTTGLFWINPDKFMPIAGPVQMYLKQKFPNFEYKSEKGIKAWSKIFKDMKWEGYNEVFDFLNNEQNNKKSFKELSLESIESSVENEILENKNVRG
jgi:5-methylcytosine-specific restriction protein B